MQPLRGTVFEPCPRYDVATFTPIEQEPALDSKNAHHEASGGEQGPVGSRLAGPSLPGRGLSSSGQGPAALSSVAAATSKLECTSAASLFAPSGAAAKSSEVELLSSISVVAPSAASIDVHATYHVIEKDNVCVEQPHSAPETPFRPASLPTNVPKPLAGTPSVVECPAFDICCVSMCV
jgi:hypothetical protein